MDLRAPTPAFVGLLTVLALSSLACLVPDLYDSEPDDRSGSPTQSNGSNNVSGDNNSSGGNNLPGGPGREPTDEGIFQVRFEGAVQGQLDATERGEATTVLRQGAPGFFATHCQIALVDQVADEEATLGLVTFRAYGDTCALPLGEHELRDAREVSQQEQERGGVIVVQRVEVEQGVERPTVTELTRTSGKLIVGLSTSRNLGATFELRAEGLIVDDGAERDGVTTITGRFTAEPAPQ